MTKTVTINATPEKVWHALTDATAMKCWMGDIPIEVVTSWQEGSPFLIRGTLYKKPFENQGQVLVFQPLRELSYSYLSSLSHLPDVPENHTVLTFRLVQGPEWN